MSEHVKFNNTPPNYLNYKEISADDLQIILKNLLDLQKLKEIKFEEKDIQNFKIYTNSEFWEKTEEREILSGQIVELNNFIITEWIPFSPGLYYSEFAMYARQEAERFVNLKFNEYTPKGKISMVNGGVGSIRLTPKSINMREFNILGATSSGITHQGLPILIDNNIYQKYINQIKDNRGIKATIVGRVRLIEDSKIIKANYHKGIPKYCIEVEELIDVESTNQDVLVTVAIAYRNSKSLNPSWTYTTIKPDKKDNNLNVATEWLAEYMERYAGEQGFNSIILNDFDEHVKWFPNTDFRLNNIIENKGINTELFKEYLNANSISIEGNVIIGNDNIIVEKVNNSNVKIEK